MLSPEVPDLRSVGADDKPSPNIADDGQQVFHTFALVAGLANEAFLASPGSIGGISRTTTIARNRAFGTDQGHRNVAHCRVAIARRLGRRARGGPTTQRRPWSSSVKAIACSSFTL